jgi:lysosomal acid lipase/cholesteryl ester hydrolase
MHRVFTNESKNGDFQPVLLQHGIEDSSYEWITNSNDKAPAFMLAREGYDVWLGNNRGNGFSEKHVKYSKNQKEFWEFDFEEMGLYDVPAEIDYLLKTNGRSDKIAAYIGHSEGTT